MKTCPSCGYELHRRDHPTLGIVRFCRRSCIRAWLVAHRDHFRTPEFADFDVAVERRAS